MARYEKEPLFGVGEAANGQIRAVVEEGRLANLKISPTFLRRNGMDSTALADEVAAAVNAALDDLVDQTMLDMQSDTGTVTAELDQVTDTLTRAIDGVRSELDRAVRRLDTR